MKKTLLFLSLLAVTGFAKPLVTASILPTKYFIEQIAGDSVEVNVMVGKGADPHTYEPKPRQMSNLEKSDIYFAVGIEFEDVWLQRFKKSYPNLKIVQTDAGVKKIAMQEHEHDEHGHSHDGHHDHDGHHHHHGGLDPHIWLDPVLVKTQAKNIADALIANYPKRAEIYKKNLQDFSQRLDAIDATIKKKLKDIKNREFMVYHPSWGYFAARYDLEQIAIEEMGKEPKPAQLAELIEHAKEHEIKVIFVAPQFSQKGANLIAKQTGAKVVEIDQLPGDWAVEILKMADIFAANLK